MLKELKTRQGQFIGQLFVDHVHGKGVTVYRESRGYSCGIARDGKAFVIRGSEVLYFAHVLADHEKLYMGM